MFEFRLNVQVINSTHLQIPDPISRIAFNSNLLSQSVVDSYFDHCLKSIKRISKNVEHKKFGRSNENSFIKLLRGAKPMDVINLFVTYGGKH